jgi:hypothetical protein
VATHGHLASSYSYFNKIVFRSKNLLEALWIKKIVFFKDLRSSMRVFTIPITIKRLFSLWESSTSPLDQSDMTTEIYGGPIGFWKNKTILAEGNH